MKVNIPVTNVHLERVTSQAFHKGIIFLYLQKHEI